MAAMISAQFLSEAPAAKAASKTRSVPVIVNADVGRRSHCRPYTKCGIVPLASPPLLFRMAFHACLLQHARVFQAAYSSVRHSTL